MLAMGLRRVFDNRNSLDTLIQQMLGRRAGGSGFGKDGAAIACNDNDSGICIQHQSPLPVSDH